MKTKVIWTAISAAVLSAISIIVATSNPSLSLAIGLSAIANAILATRE